MKVYVVLEDGCDIHDNHYVNVFHGVCKDEDVAKERVAQLTKEFGWINQTFYYEEREVLE